VTPPVNSNSHAVAKVLAGLISMGFLACYGYMFNRGGVEKDAAETMRIIEKEAAEVTRTIEQQKQTNLQKQKKTVDSAGDQKNM
jgi:hypothetical protein